MPKDTTTLRKLLTLEKDTTIYDVIGRMEILLDIFKDNEEYNGLHPFLYTYCLVTKNVAEKCILNKNYFTNINSLQRLDVYFASLYFTPLLDFLNNNDVSPPWQTYYNYSKEKYPIPFIQILLGINAHINTDLYASIVKLKYNYEKDFFIINDILQEEIPLIMTYLLKKHDLVGLSNVFLRNFIKNEFHEVIERWRTVAWANALKTNPSNFNKYHKDISLQTEDLGEKIITLFHNAYLLKNITALIPTLNTLRVDIR